MKEIIDSILPKVRRPSRYIGNELNSIHKEWNSASLHVALAYPDLYEIGMSNLGIQILYHILNLQKDVLCERVFAPAHDMEEQLRSHNIPLFSLESWTPLDKFDLIGFSLGHELTYTNLVNMLQLSGIPVFSKDRKDEDPLIFAGGPSVLNPMPAADFIDFFLIGEAEEALVEIAETVKGMRDEGRGMRLEKLSRIKGVYVPALENKVTKRYVEDFTNAPYPTKPIVPFLAAIHDRAVIEVMRGCKWGCRFCNAYSAYRPVREKRSEKVKKLTEEILKNTGYSEVSLISLSSSDYSEIEKVAKDLAMNLSKKRISISLPSLRTDSFGVKLAKEVQRVRPHSLTIAPETGTQRLRDVVGKKLSEKDILSGAEAAFSEGITNLKLYFMIGLPTETEEDLEGIVDLTKRILGIGKKYSRRAHVTAGVSTFIPKPHTPFQWEKMITLDQIKEKQKFLKANLRGKGLEMRWHEAESSVLEGVFSRGDKRLSKVIYKAWELGARLDAWSEHFHFDIWQKAFDESGIEMSDYLKEKSLDEKLPWGNISLGLSEKYLLVERERAYSSA